MLPPERIANLFHLAKTGDHVAQSELGAAYLAGDGVPKNLDTAKRWLTEAAENDITSAKEKLGELYETLKKLDLAEKWYSEAVKDNNAEAMYRLGLLIYKGKLGFRPGSEGLELLETAAKRGHKGARDYIDTYVNDPKFKRFSKIAEYKSRADLGDVGAQFQLGNMYENGIDAPVDRISAAGWYRMAADRGHSRAQYRLGMMYLEGRGVPADKDEAADFLTMAAAQGNTDAKKKLEDMGKSP